MLRGMRISLPSVDTVRSDFLRQHPTAEILHVSSRADISDDAAIHVGNATFEVLYRERGSSDSWPDNIPVPQAWLEFDVESVEKATAELELQGYRILIKNKKEPWGQTVTRLLSAEGLLVGISLTPSLRKEK